MRATAQHSKTAPRRVAPLVRRRVERGGERTWRFIDFDDLPFLAVAQALSRLTREGVLTRLGKGLYYRPRTTVFGTSRPNRSQIQRLAQARGRTAAGTVYPAGVAAANLLGFTTQQASREEVATSGLSLPRLLMGRDTIIHTRRPAAWRGLSALDAALLDFLRRRGDLSELSPTETVRRLLTLVAEKGRFERLLKVADTEPPRVRALLGAIGEELRKNQKGLRKLRDSLNPLTRFDFGLLSGLAYSRMWQAKERSIP